MSEVQPSFEAHPANRPTGSVLPADFIPVHISLLDSLSRGSRRKS